MRNVLVTGGAGFIGSHLIKSLLAEGTWKVTCLDNFDPFYSTEIKKNNIAPFEDDPNFELVEEDIRNQDALTGKLDGNYDVIVHLAAKPGVRPSIKDPVTSHQVNVGGMQNILELAKLWGTKQFVFGSSSSVYGINTNLPWNEDDKVLLPISPYASTKVAGELMGHVYSHLYGIRFIALRFFTVYGPGQRPDLAIHKFTKQMLQNRPITMFGDGSTKRDYTYIDDIVQGVRAAMDYEASKYEIINLGHNQTISLIGLIEVLEKVLGVKATIEKIKEQPGDVPQTYADISKASEFLNYQTSTDLKDGIAQFHKWISENSFILDKTS